MNDQGAENVVPLRGGAAGGDPPPSSSGGSPATGGKGARPKKKLDWGSINRLFKSFVLIYPTDTVWDEETRSIVKINALRLAFGSDTVKVWLADKERRRMVHVDNLVFEPGQNLGPDYINLFDGLPTEPEEGDCAVMIELLHYLCSTSDAPGLGPEEIADWVLRWCALPLQRPGAKLDTALVFHGSQGTGKNLFFDVLRDLYGEYGVMVGQTEIEDKYNTWLSRRLLIVGDEVVSRQEMYHAKNRLKWIVTQKTKIPIRAMHQDTRWESNHANLVFLSNEAQPLALEDGDRRYCVIYTPTKHLGDLYQRVSEFLDAGGAAKFLHFLINLDLQDFGEHTKPPLTTAKQTLIELGFKPAERFMHEWISGFLPLPMRVCGVEQLYQAFQRWAHQNGERYPPKQADFTQQARKFVDERIEVSADGVRQAPLFDYKVIQTRAGPSSPRKAMRCWIPRGCRPPEGTTEGEWAGSSIDSFQTVVRNFLRAADGEDS
ncbi:primase-helicase family protein [Roseateles sp. UC29_93]|uniref:primase-helicase family protein n=1 Tax=Roseateles sp. UC29_93 TaxID=3350177 RepID=UPI00366B3104